MSTYVLMKILESAPSRYDRGINWLTLGKINRTYDDLIAHIKSGQNVLDIGCGTGALTVCAAQQGARVKGIDINVQMLEIAKQRVAEIKLDNQVELVEMGVAELEHEKDENYNVVISGLCFSELSSDESRFTLKEAYRILKPGGQLLIADEVRPRRIFMRLLNWIVRFPLVIITYVFTQTTTRAVKDLPKKVRGSGFRLRSVKFNSMGNFLLLVAQKPFS